MPVGVGRRCLLGAYHLARKSGNFGLKSNGKVIFRKFRSEIAEYLQRYSSFSVRNGAAEISGASIMPNRPVRDQWEYLRKME